jgi:hypothetical protein
MALLMTFFPSIFDSITSYSHPISYATMISHYVTVLSSPSLLLLFLCNMPLYLNISLYVMLSTFLSCRLSCLIVVLSLVYGSSTFMNVPSASSDRISFSSLLPYVQTIDVIMSAVCRFMPSERMCSSLAILTATLASHSVISHQFSVLSPLSYAHLRVVSKLLTHPSSTRSADPD